MSRNRFMSSSNPFVSESFFNKQKGNNQSTSSQATAKTLDNPNSFSINATDSSAMTIQGTVNKSFILTAILIASAIASVVMLPSLQAYAMPAVYGSAILGLILALVSFFKPTIAYITAPAYALVEGVAVGLISGIYGAALGGGIIFNALMLTLLCLASMLVAYKTGLIKATQKFRSIITTATGAIMMIYAVNIMLSFFGMNIPYLHEGGWIGIGISLFIIGIATLNLILDFDNIEKGVAAGAPKYMEWVGSLGLLITLVWIYLEILRLLAMFSSSD